MDNLSRIIEVLSLDSGKPYALCSYKHLLYYADWSDQQVKELNCLTSPPTLLNQMGIMVDRFVIDLCIANKGLIAVPGNRVKIYNLGTKALECIVPHVLPDK